MSEVKALWLLVRGNSKLVVDQVMMAMEPHDPCMYVYYDEVHKLEENVKGFELHHRYRCFNSEGDELSAIASRHKPISNEVFTSNLYEPFFKFKQP